MKITRIKINSSDGTALHTSVIGIDEEGKEFPIDRLVELDFSVRGGEGIKVRLVCLEPKIGATVNWSRVVGMDEIDRVTYSTPEPPPVSPEAAEIRAMRGEFEDLKRELRRATEQMRQACMRMDTGAAVPDR